MTCVQSREGTFPGEIPGAFLVLLHFAGGGVAESQGVASCKLQEFKWPSKSLLREIEIGGVPTSTVPCAVWPVCSDIPRLKV